MSLRNAVSAAVGAAFKALGDVSKTVTYKRLTAQGSYNATTGTTSDTFSSTAVAAVLSRYSDWEVANTPVQATDQKMVVPYASLGFWPTAKVDFVTIDGSDWSVNDWFKDPTESLVTINLKRP